MTENLLSPKVAICFISAWMLFSAVFLFIMGFGDSKFARFGPSEELQFFGIRIDSYGKWTGVLVYTVFNQLVSTYGLETLSPWMINDIQNREKKNLSMNSITIQSIILTWYMYLWMSRIFGIQIFLTQLDFMIVVLVTDLAATYFVTARYIREKNDNYYSLNSISSYQSTND